MCLVIHQDKRMVGIITAGISTGAFAFVLIAVNPAAVHAFIQQLNVRFTKGCQSAADNLHGFVKRNGCMFTGYKTAYSCSFSIDIHRSFQCCDRPMIFLDHF